MDRFCFDIEEIQIKPKCVEKFDKFQKVCQYLKSPPSSFVYILAQCETFNKIYRFTRIGVEYKGLNFEYIFKGEYKEKYRELAKLLVLNNLKRKRQERLVPSTIYKNFYSRDHVFVTELVGNTHTQKNAIGNIQSAINEMMVSYVKTPNNDQNYVGLEIEFISPHERNHINKIVVKHKAHKFIRIMTDSSIVPDYEDEEHGFEMCVLMTENEIPKQLETVKNILTEIKAYTNDTCGLHVHFDMRKREAKLVHFNLIQAQDFLFKLVHPRRKTNNYCRPTPNIPWDELEVSHYHAISKHSFYKYRTIEVRMHEGTTDIKEINNWINLLLKIVNYGKELNIKTSADLINTYKDDKVLNDYIAMKLGA